MGSFLVVVVIGIFEVLWEYYYFCVLGIDFMDEGYVVVVGSNEY